MIIYTSTNNKDRARENQELRRSNAAGIHRSTSSRKLRKESNITEDLESSGFFSVDDVFDDGTENGGFKQKNLQ